MAYERISKMISTVRYSLKAPFAMSPQYVTIHNTWNDVTALNEVAYMTRNTSATSYHVAIDDIHAVEAIPFNRNAWHAGDGANGPGNRKSIGIEICYSKSGGDKYEKAEANAIEYVAHLLKQYGWGIDHVKWHRDWSGKNCPHRILDEGRASAVRGAIAKRLDELNAPVKVESKPDITPISKPIAPKPIIKEEENELAEKAFVINTDNDYLTARKLHIRTGYGIWERAAVKEKIAKEIIVIGGGIKGLEKFADRFTDLSGKSWEETVANVTEYMNK